MYYLLSSNSRPRRWIVDSPFTKGLKWWRYYYESIKGRLSKIKIELMVSSGIEFSIIMGISMGISRNDTGYY